MMGAIFWVPWLQLGRPAAPRGERGAGRRLRVPSLVACPHCTNSDTLTLHCADDRCGWANCTCGAVIYANRRHRHPRHRTEADTCHDPKAAA
jgi:hypothetical protein